MTATAVVAAVIAVIAMVGLSRIQTLNRNLTQTVDFLATNAKLASLIKQDLMVVTRAERNMLLARSEDGTTRFAAVVDEVAAKMEGRLQELRALVDEEDHRQLDLYSETWVKWLDNHDDVRRLTAMNSHFVARNISAGDAKLAIDRLEQALAVIGQQCQQDLAAAKQAEDYCRSTIAAEKLNLVAAASRAALEMQRAEKNLILASTEDEMRRHNEKLEPLKQTLKNRIEQLSAAAGADQMGAVREAQTASEVYIEANSRIRTVAAEIGNFLAYHFVYDVGASIAARCESLLDSLIARNEQQMQAYRRTSQETYLAARNTLLGISIFGIFFSVAITFHTGHRIARRLSILSTYANTIQTAGDLSKPTPQLGGDEVGLLAEAFDKMRQSLYEQTARHAELTQTLEAKNCEMEQFVYTVSHDMKSPLVSCRGLLGLLREDVAERNYEAILDSAERLDRAIDQLNQIIEDLLMLSRLGRKTLNLRRVDVRGLVDQLIQELGDRIAEANATIDICTDLPAVLADRSDVRRVFENLFTNALKYGRHARPEIAIGGTIEPGEVRYFVRDNGPGIDPRYHERVFGLFQRLDTDQPGTGLGLASVGKIMSMHGGRTWVESEPGQGATFWVAFPNSPRPARR